MPVDAERPSTTDPTMRALDGVLAEALGARRGFDTAEAMLHALSNIDLAGFHEATRHALDRGSPDLTRSGVRQVPKRGGDDAMATTQSRRIGSAGRARGERAVALAVLLAGVLMSALLFAVLLAAMR